MCHFRYDMSAKYRSILFCSVTENFGSFDWLTSNNYFVDMHVLAVRNLFLILRSLPVLWSPKSRSKQSPLQTSSNVNLTSCHCLNSGPKQLSKSKFCHKISKKYFVIVARYFFLNHVTLRHENVHSSLHRPSLQAWHNSALCWFLGFPLLLSILSGGRTKP